MIIDNKKNKKKDPEKFDLNSINQRNASLYVSSHLTDIFYAIYICNRLKTSVQLKQTHEIQRCEKKKLCIKISNIK